MQKHLLYINLFTITSALALAACADEVDGVVTPDAPEVEVGEKTPIELSVGGVDSPNTRAIITNGTTNTNFGCDTKVFILMKSEKEVDTEGNVVVHNGYEYRGDRTSTLYTVSRGDVVSSNPTVLVFDDKNKKFWDDAHGRSTQLTLWAVAQKIAQSTVDGKWKSITFRKVTSENPGISESSNAAYNTNNKIEWSSSTEESVYPAIYSWSVGNPHTEQNENTLVYQDLLFSNNISYNKEQSWADSRLKFDFANNIFPASTELKFRHAMSKITINLVAGAGFKADGTDFSITSKTLSGFNTQGLFNIKDGEFQLIHHSDPISVMPCTTKTDNNPYYTLQVLAIPNIHEFLKTHSSTDGNSRFVKDGTNVMMEFAIDGNKYEITSGALYNALHTRDADGNITETLVSNASKKTDNGTYIPLEAGKHYVFTFRINKSGINNLSATLADWETVPAVEADAQIKINAANYAPSSSTDERVDAFDLYVKANTATTYATSLHSSVTTSGTSYSYDPILFWPAASTETYYLRGFVDPVDGKPSLKESSAYRDFTGTSVSEGYAVNMTRGNDYKWGTTFNGTETDKGKAISPTSGNVHLQFEHVMSQVTVIVKTVDSPDAAKVDLAGSKCVITGLNKQATINLHTGDVAPVTGTDNTSEYTVYTLSDTDSPVSTGYMQYQIPQATFSGNDIKFVIKLKDRTVYELPLSDEALTTGSNAITQWEKGKAYKYILTLKKQEIKVAAQLTDWGTLTTADSDIQL